MREDKWGEGKEGTRRERRGGGKGEHKEGDLRLGVVGWGRGPTSSGQMRRRKCSRSSWSEKSISHVLGRFSSLMSVGDTWGYMWGTRGGYVGDTATATPRAEHPTPSAPSTAILGPVQRHIKAILGPVCAPP